MQNNVEHVLGQGADGALGSRNRLPSNPEVVTDLGIRPYFKLRDFQSYHGHCNHLGGKGKLLVKMRKANMRHQIMDSFSSR